MGRYTRDMSWDHFKSNLDAVVFLAFYIVVISSFIVFSEIADESTELDREISLYAALQGKNVNDDRANETARIFNEMYAGKLDDYSSFVGQKENIANHNSIFWAVANWDKTAMYLEYPNKELPENHLWGDMFKWFFPMIFLFVSVLFSIAYFFKSSKDDFWKYPWTRGWAIPTAIFVLPYIVLTQPFVLIYLLIREPAEYINDYLESCRVGYKKESQKKVDTFEDGVRRARNQDHYVRSSDDILELKKKYEIMIKEKLGSLESARKNFLELCDKMLQNNVEEIGSQIESIRSGISLYGMRIERSQKDILVLEQKLEKRRAVLESSLNRYDLEKMFDKILKLPIVKAIEINSSGNISIFTGTIFVSYENRISRIGNLEIIIDPLNIVVRIRNHTNTSTVRRNHPYGDPRSDEFCFGDFKSEIDKALRYGDFLLATVMILQALQSGKGGGRGDGIVSWEEVNKRH